MILTISGYKNSKIIYMHHSQKEVQLLSYYIVFKITRDFKIFVSYQLILRFFGHHKKSQNRIIWLGFYGKAYYIWLNFEHFLKYHDLK